MENLKFISPERMISKIDKKVLRMAEALKLDGLVFNLSIPNENEISIEVAGKKITFTKLDPFPTKDKKGNETNMDIAEYIEKRIREELEK